jgi:hypothetical protein
MVWGLRIQFLINIFQSLSKPVFNVVFNVLATDESTKESTLIAGIIVAHLIPSLPILYGIETRATRRKRQSISSNVAIRSTGRGNSVSVLSLTKLQLNSSSPGVGKLIRSGQAI